MVFDLRKLQKGNSVLGIATSGVPGEDINLTQNAAGAIGTAFTMWLARKIDKPVFTLKMCIGNDSRESSEELKAGIMMGVQMTGSKSFDAGLAVTPAMEMAPAMPFFEFDGAVMVTGAAAPGNMNGFKFFTEEGPLDDETVAWILDKAFKYAFIGEWYECEPVNVMQMYAAQLRRTISEGLAGFGGNLKGLHVVVDASCGAGGFFAEEVLAKLGADIGGSVYLEPDGSFPGHGPDTENEETIRSLMSAVKENKADLGLLFDADMSHCVGVDKDGNVIREMTATDGDGASAAVNMIIGSVKNR